MNKKAIVTGVCLAIFIFLTVLISRSVAAGNSDVLTFDTVIREWFYSIRTPWLTEMVKAITFMGNTKTIVTICVLLLVVPLIIGKVQITKKIAVPIGAVAIIGSAINKIFKHTITRPRPDISLHLIEQGGWSFPSGHSISGLLLYGFLVWLIRRYALGEASKQLQVNGDVIEKGKSRMIIVNIATVILTILWIGVGLSRIYLGVHYPTDILGGWILGMVVMMAAIMIIEKIESEVMS